MAYGDSSAAIDTHPAGFNGSNRGYEQAVGFLNFYLPADKGGEPVKFGYAAFKASDGTQAKILAHIEKHGPEKVCEMLLKSMTIKYNPNTKHPDVKQECGLELDDLLG